jgi:hypothetical protein
MAVTYVTATELKANTNNAALAALSDAAVGAKIEAAEIYVDSYAGYWQKYDEDQTRLFPRKHDVDSAGDTFIPEAVKFATIAQVEFMYENMPDRDHGIMQDEKPTVESLSPRLRQLMKGYTKRTGRITFPEDDIQSVSDIV